MISWAATTATKQTSSTIQQCVFSEGLPLYETEKTHRPFVHLVLENDGKARQLARYVKEVGERYVITYAGGFNLSQRQVSTAGIIYRMCKMAMQPFALPKMNENYTRQHQDIRTENGIQYGDALQHIDYEYLRKNTVH